MKKFNIVSDHTVTLFNWKSPLPINSVYGRVEDNVYTFVPATGHLTVYDMDGREVPGKFPAIVELLTKFRPKWENLGQIRYCNHEKRDTGIIRRMKREEHRPCAGAPRERKAQTSYIYKGGKPLGGGMSGEVYATRKSEDDPWEVRKVRDMGQRDPNQGYFEVGQNTAGDVAFLPKRNGMYVHDVQKCRDDKKDVKKVTGEIHSRKASKFDKGAEYAVANYQLTPKEAIQALVMGGLSPEMGHKAYRQAH